MHRRRFLTQMLQSLPLLYLSPSLTGSELPQNTQQGKGKKIIVIGAGISGLAAAKKLHESGFEVIVLEAQSQVGGRIKTNLELGFPFEEGAHWIHGPQKNPITPLAEAAALDTFIPKSRELKVFDLEGKALTDGNLAKAVNKYRKLLKAVEKAGTADQSIADVLAEQLPESLTEPLWRFLFSAFLEFDLGGDIEALSSKYFDDDDEFDGEDLLVTNGYRQLPEFLAKNLHIQFNERVKEIDYSASEIKVKTTHQVFEAHQVVVSLPLGVLKKHAVEFLPILPENKTKAIHGLQMGNVNKFLLLWEKPFWDTETHFLGYTPEKKGKFNFFLNYQSFSSTPALMTFAFGNYASLTETQSDASITADIMAHLKKIYGENIPPPQQLLRTGWGQNENAFGAYSFVPKGAHSQYYDQLAEAVNGKLFFTGEHTSRIFRGTVHGAYISGCRAADEILGL